MFLRSHKIGRIAGFDVFLHWSMWWLPFAVLLHGLILYPIDEAVLQIALVAAVYGIVACNDCAHLIMARLVHLGIRDLTLYPIGGSVRWTEMSERPWKEIRVAGVGPLVYVFFAGVIALVFIALDWRLAPRLQTTEPYVETFLNRLFWLNVLFAILHVVPAFPMDGGRIFRGALALSAHRLRATEVAALLNSFVALLFLISGMIWISTVGWMIVIGIIIHVSGQQELLRERYFASLLQPMPATPASSPILVPIDQLLNEKSRPTDADFSGFTWSEKTRLWTLWRGGQPQSAFAIMGD